MQQIFLCKAYFLYKYVIKNPKLFGKSRVMIVYMQKSLSDLKLRFFTNQYAQLAYKAIKRHSHTTFLVAALTNYIL